MSLVATNNGVSMTQGEAVSIIVTNFALGVSPASTSVTAGQSASLTVTVTPQSGAYSNPVTLACSNLPGLSTCSFSQPSLTPGSSAATSTVTPVDHRSLGAAAAPL